MRLPRAVTFGATAFAVSATSPSRCLTQAFSFTGRTTAQVSGASHQKRNRRSATIRFHHHVSSTHDRSTPHQVQQQRRRRGRHRGSMLHFALILRTGTSLRMAFDPDVSPAALDAFHKWLGTKRDSNLKIGDQLALAGRSPLDGGRGLVATKSIERGKNVLAIPLSLALTASGLSKSGIAKYVKGGSCPRAVVRRCGVSSSLRCSEIYRDKRKRA